MNCATALFILTFGLLPLAVNAQESPPTAYLADKQTGEIKQLRGSVDSLLQALIHVSRQEGQQAVRQDVTSKVQPLIRQSEQLLEQGKLDQARQRLSRALVIIKVAIKGLKASSPQSNASQVQESEQQAASGFVVQKRQRDIDKMKSSIDALMQALTRIGAEKQQSEMVGVVAGHVIERQQQSDELAEQGKLVQARQLLDQCLVEIKTAIASMRDSETLVRSLDFATKQEEYAYEVDRVDTYQMLLQMLVLPKPKLSDSQRQLIEQWAEDARRLRMEAEEQAAAGQYKEAVETLEGAGRTLLKAIRRGGVYLPG